MCNQWIKKCLGYKKTQQILLSQILTPLPCILSRAT